MLHNLAIIEVLRRCFVPSFIISRFVTLVRIIIIVFWVLLLFVFFCWCFLMVAFIYLLFFMVTGDDVFHFNVFFCWKFGFLAIDGDQFKYFLNIFLRLGFWSEFNSQTWYFSTDWSEFSIKSCCYQPWSSYTDLWLLLQVCVCGPHGSFVRP